MTPLAAFSILASEMPGYAAWPLALAALAYGAWLVRREWQRPPVECVFAEQGARVLVGGVLASGVELQWRGPLVLLRWRDGEGRLHRWSWWPDTLPAAQRRELRLAMPGQGTARRAPSMAP